MTRTRLYTLIFGCAILVVTPCLDEANGGSLTPPPGPIQPTDRVTLNEQFITLPFTISQPGSYVLTSNLTGVAGQDGILISANGVTLDLNGFQLAGVPGSGHGIAFLGISVTGVTIVNGSIAGWGGDGISGLNAFPVYLDGLVFFSSVGTGAHLGAGAAVSNCVFRGNGGGLLTGSAATVRGCTAVINGGDGIAVGPNSIVSHCAATSNGSNGISGATGCVIEGCSSTGNTGIGITADQSLIRGNCAGGNGVSQIVGGSSTVIENHTF